MQKITVYTTSSCPYCIAAKELLNRKKYAYKEVDVSDPSMRMMLVKKAQGRKTVPQIFIGDLHVGGFDDLAAMDKAGELDTIMATE
jgi:Glutaredoxin, GrxC family